MAKSSVTIKTAKGAGMLSVAMPIALASYNGEPVVVRLDDDDSQPIVQRASDARSARPLGKELAVQVQSSEPPEGPAEGDRSRVVQDHRHSQGVVTFSDANETADVTRLTVTVGGQCFVHAATKKKD